MKKLILIIAVAALCSSVVFGQTDKSTDKSTTNPPAKATTNPPQKPATLHYTWSNGKLMNCMGETAAPQSTDVKLKNGATVSASTGMVTMKDGKKVQLKENECIDMNGKIVDHASAHMNKNMKNDNMKSDNMKGNNMKKDEPAKTAEPKK